MSSQEYNRVESSQRFSLYTLVLLLGIVVLGAHLRLAGLGQPSLWYDEILHLRKTQEALEEPWHHWIIGLEADQENGALYYATQSLALRVVDGESGVRLAPAVFGCVTLVVMAVVGTVVGGTLIGVLTTLLLVVAPLHVFFSREGRPYAILALIAALLLLLLLQSHRRWAIPAAYALCLAAAYTSALATTLLVSYGALSLIDGVVGRRRSRHRPQDSGAPNRSAWHFPTAAAIGVLLVAVFYLARTHQHGLIDPSTALIASHPLSGIALERLFAGLTVSGVEWASWQPRTLIIFALAIWGVVALARRSPRKALFAAGMFVLPMGLTMVVIVVFGRWFSVRYAVAAQPALWLLVAVGLGELVRLLVRLSGRRMAQTPWVTIGVAFVLTTLLAGPNLVAARREPYQKPDWRGVVDLIADLAGVGEPIITASSWPHTCLSYYFAEADTSIEIVDARGSVEITQHLASASGSAWLISAGYARTDELRTWMRSFVPVLKSPLPDLELHFYPDFSSFTQAPDVPRRMEKFQKVFLESGRRLEFDDSSLLLGSGWSYPEASQAGVSFRWADWSEAEIGLPLTEASDLSLALRLFPLPSSQHPPQTVELLLNSEPIASWALEPGWNEVEVQIPAERWRAGVNLATFRFGWVVSPAELDGSSPDERTLAAAFDYLALKGR